MICIGGSSYAQDYKGDHELLFFPVGERNATVDQATLRVFVTAPLGGASSQLLLLTYQVTTGGTPILLDSKSLILHQTSRWADLDVAPAVQAWLSGTAR